MGKLANAAASTNDRGFLIRTHSKYLVDASKTDRSHKDGKTHPSGISGCLTASIIGILLLDEVVHDPQLLNIFGLGHSIHDRLQKEYIAAGLITTLKNGKPAIEVPLSMPEHNLVGHADGIVYTSSKKDRKAVLEIKSINSMAFAKLTEPKPDHKIQAACYVLALADTGEIGDSKEVIFIYYSKNDSKMKEFRHIVTPKEEEFVLGRIELIKEMIIDYTENPRAPEPTYENVSQPACRYCSYKKHCHDTFFRRDWDKKLRESKGKQNEPHEEPKEKVLQRPKRKAKKLPAIKRRSGRTL